MTIRIDLSGRINGKIPPRHVVGDECWHVGGLQVQGIFLAGTVWIPKKTFQGTIGCTLDSVPMVFIAFSTDSWGL